MKTDFALFITMIAPFLQFGCAFFLLFRHPKIKRYVGSNVAVFILIAVSTLSSSGFGPISFILYIWWHSIIALVYALIYRIRKWRTKKELKQKKTNNRKLNITIKYARKIILRIFILTLICCRSRTDNKTKDLNSKIYFASKRIYENFIDSDSITIEYITKYLKQDSIKVVIRHSTEDSVEVIYLKGSEKVNFFYNPKIYNKQKIRQKSDFYNVNQNCYEFNNEGINHNSLYFEKLCYINDLKGVSLAEIYLLDGD